jgi:Subtilase family
MLSVVDTSFQMNPAGTSRGRMPRRSVALVVLAACSLAPGAARAADLGAGQANLSPRLEELASPLVRAAPRAAQAQLLGLPASGPGSLLRRGGRVLVDVRFDHGAAAGVAGLEAAGAELVDLARAYQTVTVAATPAQLPALGQVTGVGGVTEVLAPIVQAADCGGSVRSEGDAQLQAAEARANWGVDGSGVTVGILSDSFNRRVGAVTHAEGDVKTGDLPGPESPCGSNQPVGVLDDADSKGEDEGRAMAQVVHDLAPGAAIDFATAFTGETAFAANIRALASAGAKVIADDVTYFEEPFFQDGPVAQAVNEVTAGGVSYFSAAGNDNLIEEVGGEEEDVASWEAPAFRDSGSCPAAIVGFSEEIEAEEEAGGQVPPQGLNPSHCMDFDPGSGEDQTFGITVEPEATLRIDLQWAEPWFGVGTDLDAFLLDEEGKLLAPEVEGTPTPVASLEENIHGSEQPFEFLSWENPGAEEEVQLVINRFGPEAPPTPPPPPRLKFALLENGGGVSATEYPKSSPGPNGDVVGPTVFGHAGAQSAIGVAAVRFDQGNAPEEYSSRGPVSHYFGPVAGHAAAAALQPPQTIEKPDLAATDCGVTTFFAKFEGGAWRFCGTSAAAPHAAAVAALMRQANPTASAAQVRVDLAATALPVGGFGPGAVGAGLVDANAAVDLLALPPQVTITKPPAPLSRERRPTIEFTADRPVAFSCAVDGGPAQPCASPFTVPAALEDGQHGIAVSGTDLAGRTGGSGAVLFRIDTTAPRTIIAAHPPKLLRTHGRRARAVFRFRSNESPVTFVCKVDQSLLRFCGARFARRFDLGRHVLRVRAQDAAGNLDRSAAVYRFRVKRVR